MTTHRTDVCIAGGGPAGVFLGLLLARAGVDVMVLEKHDDFFRDFRGDTVHPSTVNLIDALGLRAAFDAVPHEPLPQLDAVINGIRIHLVDFTTLPPPNRFITLMPQWDLLDMLAEAGSRHPSFHLTMGAEVAGVTERDGRVTGVVTTSGDAIEARLVVAADGRTSTVRDALGFTPEGAQVDTDVLWFRVPRPERPLPDTLGWASTAGVVITIPRPEYLQCALLVRKDEHFDTVEAFRDRVVQIVPRLAPVIEAVASLDDVKRLNVQINRLPRWWRPGALCIGDAAHAMSPVFGVGINYAVQDAVAAARVLIPVLRPRGSVKDAADEALDAACEAVQRRRERPTAMMQAIQRRAHVLLGTGRVAQLIDNPPTRAQRTVLRLALPVLRRVVAQVVGYGFRPERL
ncbi:FAD-dependent oxidoreductase [Microbacterium horticulturae]|uniref:FAD-dependent oxidoreductase n=1 Tax=Microbacterium horticulturae TaxID=3028316 RepID=A0ABY8BYK9_9MICO|nr:FAD-dependent oxidoreductase [Microbacterium sp. KACC 23027]WEG09291.1 FAD-dependent oxidoreductase [Microbacterium sp. KACC 23027]